MSENTQEEEINLGALYEIDLAEDALKDRFEQNVLPRRDVAA